MPDHILLKPGKLTEEEFEIMKKHTTFGRDAIIAAEKFITYSHHEKWDATGYPEGLKGDDIPISARLMAVADVYDALISKRVYKPAFSHEKAVDIIKGDSGTHFDPEIRLLTRTAGLQVLTSVLRGRHKPPSSSTRVPRLLRAWKEETGMVLQEAMQVQGPFPFPHR